MYKSKFEEDLASFYKLEDKYETSKIEYVLKNTYTPDFTVANTVFIEAKGFFKPSDRRKMLELTKQHPDKHFIMFFQDSTVKLTRKSKTTYGDWCDKNGFEWYCWKTKRPTKKLLNMAIKLASN